jgi:hypothetical protein
VSWRASAVLAHDRAFVRAFVAAIWARVEAGEPALLGRLVSMPAWALAGELRAWDAARRWPWWVRLGRRIVLGSGVGHDWLTVARAVQFALSDRPWPPTA